MMDRVRQMPLFRVLSADKVVDSRVLNLLGAQVVRTVAARAIYNRGAVSAAPAVSAKVAELQRDGITTWAEFLPSSDFEDLRRECRELVETQHELFTAGQSGPNTNDSVKVRRINRQIVPSLLRFLADPRLIGLLEAAERRPIGDLSAIARIERLTQGSADGLEDPQTQLHSDIFFTSHKVWYYLSDVDESSGPLVFVKGSHRLTPRELREVYTWSWTRSPDAVNRTGNLGGRIN